MTDLGIRDRVVARDNLLAALDEVRRRDAADGLMSRSALEFLADPIRRIESIADHLDGGTFVPSPLQHVPIPKANGGVRNLAVPPFGDRVAERAVARVVTDLIDPGLGAGSFAYRPGLGVRDCVRRLAEARDEGARHVLRSDVDECFDSIPHSRLVTLLRATVPDDWLARLVELLLARPVRYQRWQRRRTRGTPQGAPLSPLLANLYLEQFDRAVLAAGYPVVRYADDFAVPFSRPDQADVVMGVVTRALAELELEPNEEDTLCATFEAGFQFVGTEFGPRIPVAGEEERQKATRRILYVTKQGASVGLERGQVTVRVRGDRALAVPRGQVERIVLFGNVGLSSWLRNTALYEGLDIVCLSSRGRYLGRLSGLHDTGPFRRSRQVTRARSMVEIAAAIVAGKISNMRSLLQRRARKGGPELAVVLGRLEQSRVKALSCRQRESLLGLEGTATAGYFGALKGLLPPDAGFDGRNRRPPRDAVNAALSFGYSILLGEVVGACAGAGLDPNVGFLHSSRKGRPALALDLMEEFRALVVDTVVLEMFRRGSLNSDSVTISAERGALLTDSARNLFIGAIEERFLTVFSHVPSRTRTTYRRALHLQARQIADIVDGRRKHYEPVRWR